MGNSRKILTIILTALVLACLLTSCGRPDPLIGTWGATEVKSGDTQMSVQQLWEMLGEKQTAELEFGSDNEAVGTIMGKELNGKWSISEEGYVLSDSGDVQVEFTLKDNIFELTYAGYSIVFERISE